MCWRQLAAVALFSVIMGCEYPKDPQGTLDRVRGGTLHVGVMPHDPWVRIDGKHVAGLEAALVQSLADELGATVQWYPGGETNLFEQLRRFELDLVIGGLTTRSLWSSKVAMSKPIRIATEQGRKQSYVWAMPSGENAWVMHVDAYLALQKHRRLSEHTP